MFLHQIHDKLHRKQSKSQYASLYICNRSLRISIIAHLPRFISPKCYISPLNHYDLLILNK